MYKGWKKCGNTIAFCASFIDRLSERWVTWGGYGLRLLSCCWGVNGKPTDRICWFLERTRTGEECQGPLRRFDEAISRFVNGDLNCWACTRHWMRASREANEYCSSPFLEQSTQLSKRSISKRFYYIFDRLGANTPNHRRGIRWCNKCATIADNALSKESDYIPPKVSVQMFILFPILFLSRKVSLIY